MSAQISADVDGPWTRARRLSRRIGDLWIFQGYRGVFVATVALVLLTWPFSPESVQTGIDSSWRTGLSIATAEHLAFGRDIVWTYGPLGFLISPFVDSAQGMVTIGVRALLDVVLVAVVLLLLRRCCSLGTAVLIALPVVALGTARFIEYLGVGQVLTLLIVIWSFSYLTAAEDGTWPWLAGMGAVLGVATLSKFDAFGFGLVAAYAICARAYVTGAGLRGAVSRVAIFAAAFVATVITVWVAFGQPLSTLRPWFSYSLEVVRGYSDAMGTEKSVGFGVLEYAFPPLLLVAYTWLILRDRTHRLGYRLAVVGLVALVLYLGFKAGFVRHTLGHSVYFFALVAVIPLGLLTLLGLPRALALLGVGLVGFLAATSVYPSLWFSPNSTVTRFADSAKLVISSRERSEFIADGRARLRDSYALPDELVEMMRGRTIHVEPSETNIVYAYPELRWRPLPVFNSSAAYTPALDDLNANFLAGARRPQRVLRDRQPIPVDYFLPRLGQFESPRAALELACHYRPEWSDTRWELLRAAQNRCGASRTLGERRASLGSVVKVPRPSDPNAIVVATFHGLNAGVANNLRSLLYRSPEFSITSRGLGLHRFLTGTQEEPHILRMPACAEASDDIEFGSFTISKQRDVLSTGHDYDVEFSEIPYVLSVDWAGVAGA